eukprot:10902491-Alexandrium_andersonii.AAC.1
MTRRCLLVSRKWVMIWANAGCRAWKKLSGSPRDWPHSVSLRSAMCARACLRWGPGLGQARKPSKAHSPRRVCRCRMLQVAFWRRFPQPSHR